jgi:hypothetical protein
MTKQQAMAIKAEQYVRKVVTQTFGQKASAKVIKSAAAKVVLATAIVERPVKKTA